jgi:hypothetical protein
MMEDRNDIYISYRRADGWQYANALMGVFARKGYWSYGQDDHYLAGRYNNETIESINSASIFLVMLTQGYLDSLLDESSYVYQELSLAIQLHKIIVLILPRKDMAACPLPEGIPEVMKQTIRTSNGYLILFNDRIDLDTAVEKLIQERIVPVVGIPGVTKHHDDVLPMQQSTMWERLKYKLGMSPKEDLLSSYSPKRVDYDIFISYRRIDGRDHARNIQLALKAAGYKRIFFDYNSIQKGEFTKRIIDAVYSCKDFILVLSPKSMKRCGKEGDPVANEIRAAAKYNKNIIPLTIDNKSVVWPRSFPQDLEFIRGIQFHDHKTDSYFESSIEDLCTKLTTKLEQD